MPKISIVIVIDQGADSADAAINQLRRQGLRRWEALLVYTGDDQKTLDRLAAIEISERRSRILTAPLASPAAARNLGVFRARADLVAFFDPAEDWGERTLSNLLTAFEAEPGLAAVLGGPKQDVFAPDAPGVPGAPKQITGARVTAQDLLVNPAYEGPITTAFRREAYLNTGGAPETGSTGPVRDWLVRLAAFGGVVSRLTNFVVDAPADRRRSRAQWRRMTDSALRLGVNIDPLEMRAIEATYICDLAKRAAKAGASRRALSLVWHHRTGLNLRKRLGLTIIALSQGKRLTG